MQTCTGWQKGWTPKGDKGGWDSFFLLGWGLGFHLFLGKDAFKGKTCPDDKGGWDVFLVSCCGLDESKMMGSCTVIR